MGPLRGGPIDNNFLLTVRTSVRNLRPALGRVVTIVIFITRKYVSKYDMNGVSN